MRPLAPLPATELPEETLFRRQNEEESREQEQDEEQRQQEEQRKRDLDEEQMQDHQLMEEALLAERRDFKATLEEETPAADEESASSAKKSKRTRKSAKVEKAAPDKGEVVKEVAEGTVKFEMKHEKVSIPSIKTNSAKFMCSKCRKCFARKQDIFKHISKGHTDEPGGYQHFKNSVPRGTKVCQECSKIFPLGVTALFDHKVFMHGLGSKE